MFLTPPSSPPPFPSFVENTSLRYNYIKEEKPPSPDPYGIGLENGNNFVPLPINVSCDIPLLNLHKIYFDLSSPPRSGEGTSSAARVATAMNGGAVVRAPLQSSKNTVRRTASSVNTGIAATIIHQPFHFMEMDNVRATPIVVPSSCPNNTYSGNVAVTVAPPPVPQIELEAPLVPFPYPNSKQGASQRPFEASTILVKRNKIVVAPVSAFAAESMARQQYLRRPELAHFPNHRDREWLTKEIVNHIHKATLKELNNLA
ncbi:hypothetical protein TanjilG_27716 [Lupinus angustifolius]|uniref:Uncharacterized protein n=1 Tax=Lupinus angustifolius TaxID=3871 RepID=A0A4P1RHK3_LUPAN|nr:hypothetical protein TanjilG_27716 [Lupinus angustifolius]